MSTARRNKRRKKGNLGNRMALVGISFVVFSMAVVITLRGNSLRKTDLEYQVKEENLMRQVAQEEERSAQLEQERIYVQTKQYIEQMAKEKLGLVNPDEILLKPAD